MFGDIMIFIGKILWVGMEKFMSTCDRIFCLHNYTKYYDSENQIKHDDILKCYKCGRMRKNDNKWIS